MPLPRPFVILLAMSIAAGCPDDTVQKRGIAPPADAPALDLVSPTGFGTGDDAHSGDPVDIEGTDTTAATGQPDTGDPPDGVTPPDPGGTGDTGADATTDTGPDIEPNPCGSWAGADASGGAAGDSDFPWGVASGGIRMTSAVIWTRLTGAGEVVVHYSAGPQCDDLQTAAKPATVEAGRTVRVALSELQPNTLYRYRVEKVSGAGLSSPGWFVTPPQSASQPFRLMFAGDISDDSAYFDLLPDVVATDAELLLWLGDWPYADHDAPAKTLAQYRQKHAIARMDGDVHGMLRYMAVHAVWDDHEILNDWDGENGKNDPARVAAGMQAWREWFPYVGDAPGEIYRRYSWGPAVEIFQLDCRSHRDANSAPNDADKTMLGYTQLVWLLNGLSDSTARFKLIITSVPLDHGTTGSDHWPGFLEERETILGHIVQGQIGGVVFLTADQHWLAAHHMPHGPKEFQTGPVGTFLRSPKSAPAWVPIQAKVMNYGLLDYAAGPPATLTFTAWGEDAELLYTEVVREGRGSIQIQPSVPAAQWTLGGAHIFAGKGAVTLPWATPGDYTIAWQSASGGKPPPPPQTLTLNDGGTITFVGDYDTATDGATFVESFESGKLAPIWTIINQGVDDNTPSWSVTAGAATETGNAYDKNLGEEVVPKLGTFLWAEQADFGQGTFSTAINAGDDDGWGVMYGMQSADTYYRCNVDQQRTYARLVRVDNGKFTVLDEDLNYSPPTGAWTTLTITREGAKHTCSLNGQPIVTATDGTYPAGSLALYSWGMSSIAFDDVVVFGP